MVRRLEAMPLSSAEARKILLAVPKSDASRHMDRMAYRAGGRIFATLRESDGTLNVMLPKDIQAAMCEAEPKVFAPVPGGWGPLGWTNVNLATASETDVKSALQAAVAESLVNKRAKRR
jgi:hypothetical protein